MIEQLLIPRGHCLLISEFSMLSTQFAAPRSGIAHPCISSKPFMRRIAVRTLGLAEKYRAGAESGEINIFAGGNCPSSFRATN